MAQKVCVLVGTKKGAFVLDGDAARKTWSLRGPFCEVWPINHVVADPGSGALFGAGGNEWFGPAVWKSTDLGRNWTHSSEGLAYAEGEEPIKAVWSLAPNGGSLYAGVEPAGPGSHATRARAATSCLRDSAIRTTASACIRWRWRRG